MEFKTNSDCRACVLSHTYHYAGSSLSPYSGLAPGKVEFLIKGTFYNPVPVQNCPALLSPEFNRVLQGLLTSLVSSKS